MITGSLASGAERIPYRYVVLPRHERLERVVSYVTYALVAAAALTAILA